MKALVTAGPTQEPLDPVRFLANRSSGKQGYAIAGALAHAGAETTLVSGPTALTAPSGVKLVKVTTAREMLAACEAALPADVGVFRGGGRRLAARDRDEQEDEKTRRRQRARHQTRAEPRHPGAIAHGAHRPRLVIGFAAETDDLIGHARAKLAKKGADWIVANDVSPGTGIMGGEKNTVHLITTNATEDWPELDKAEVGRRLAARIADALRGEAA